MACSFPLGPAIYNLTAFDCDHAKSNFLPSPERQYQFVNPIKLAPIPSGDLTAGGSGDGIFFESNSAQRRYHKYAAAFLDDPDSVGLFNTEAVGTGTYVYPPAFTAAIDSGTLVGYRTLLTSAGQFFNDEAFAERTVYQNYLSRLSQPGIFSNEGTGLRPTDRGEYFRFDPGDRRTMNVPGNAVVLCSDEPLSYGSFLFRVVPKVWAMRKLGLTNLPCIVLRRTERRIGISLL